MHKEIIISIIIVVCIVAGNIITQKYAKESIYETSNGLMELRKLLEENKEKIETEELKGNIEEINNKWQKRHDKLAYFIEHDELEKVETNITSLKSFIQTDEYSEAISELDKCDFILKHIEEKYKFNLQNIF